MIKKIIFFKKQIWLLKRLLKKSLNQEENLLIQKLEQREKLFELYEGVKFLNSKIGKYSYIAYNTIVDHVDIGNYTSIGPNCTIGFGNHPVNYLTTSPSIFLETETPNNKDYGHPRVIVENDVWIGANVFIKSGIKIGNGAIIGAGSIVIRDVPPFAIQVGNPARTIRFRFPPETIEHILKINWWDWPIEKLKGKKNLFNCQFEPSFLSELENYESF